jgi:hypothetical protein
MWCWHITTKVCWRRSGVNGYVGVIYEPSTFRREDYERSYKRTELQYGERSTFRLKTRSFSATTKFWGLSCHSPLSAGVSGRKLSNL